MIHPDTELKYIHEDIGYGVFATRPMPRGTIVYVRDPLEIVVAPAEFHAMDLPYRSIVEKYSYRDETGSHIVSWDHAKYVNHRCDCNTMSCGYGFEIALRDIQAGEEITDEYGLFNIPYEIDICCDCMACRRVLRPDDIDRYHQKWDAGLRQALSALRQVEQPLWSAMDELTRSAVNAWLDGHAPYRSVYSLKFHGASDPSQDIRHQHRVGVD